MIPSPIRKALSTIQRHQVAHLLMGGQACVLYGAAEFSRDLDLALLPDPSNLDRLQAALNELGIDPYSIGRTESPHYAASVGWSRRRTAYRRQAAISSGSK